MASATNEIRKRSIASIGYDFVPSSFLPEGQNEYYLRNVQNQNGIEYRQLNAYEIEVLVRNRNTAENWNNLLVSDAFNPELVKNCKFFGLVRIGKLEAFALEFSDLRVPVGIYNSTIISCDFGDNVVINNVTYLSHYIIGSEVIISNVNEMVTTNHAKFGNGILKEGEEESVRIWLELCNENGGRSVIPFDGMLPGDAYLWTKFRNDEALLNKFKEFTEAKFDKKRGYYGKVGDRTVIKNCSIIKDVLVGSDAYLKGANKLKNLTINSGPEGKSQIGEGCEMVNGIMGFGCRAFYGVKAVRFVMSSHSQLKYGARLINSYLGNNSTISCCEVLNSLIFPAHEQHHNNSFLTAATVMGQSNIAAGATIGSNHNSRSADGELMAGRGFWPGLCVSLKHNSKFASFTILAKGDFPAELNIPIPFSLVSNDVFNDRLVIMPAYWFMYNMYALERNGWKYADRDKRKQKIQHLEYNYLAPDSINDMVEAIQLFEELTGEAWLKKFGSQDAQSAEQATAKGKQLLENNDDALTELEILAPGFENSKRKVVLVKVPAAYQLFKELVQYYLVNEILQTTGNNAAIDLSTLEKLFEKDGEIETWMNVGGQLILREEVEKIKQDIKEGKIKSWDDVHAFYKQQEENYNHQKLKHAVVAYGKINNNAVLKLDEKILKKLLESAVATKEWMTEGIYKSREKDYTNPFRKMPFENQQEMEAVIGKLEDNSFIIQQKSALEKYKIRIAELIEKL
jgi:hypothetical protein